jgi:hypothetical protein
MAKLFGKAAPKSGAKKTSDSPILVAEDVLDPATQAVILTRDQVVDAINGYAEGKSLEKKGQSLMNMHKESLGVFARLGFAKCWCSTGAKPRSPKLVTKADGTGTQITMSFINKPSMLNDDQYKQMVNLLGAANAEECVERFTQYTIDARLASQKIDIGGTNQTVQDHIESALLAYFPEDKHELLGQMLKPKEVFQTRKGVLDRLLDLVGRGHPKAAERLADALVKCRVITSYKAGAVADEDDDDE